MKNVQNISKTIINMLFILLIFLPCFMYLGIKVRGQKNISDVENKSLVKLPKVSLDGLLDGTYQDVLETGLSDQLIYSQTIKRRTKEYEGAILRKLFGNSLSPTSYIAVSDTIYRYINTDYLVYRPVSLDKIKEDIDNNAEHYNELLKNTNTYLYLVDSSRSIDFNNINDDIYQYIISKYNFKDADHLKIDSFTTFSKYFHKTDHHWNYQGQYQGYKDIIKLLLGEKEKTLEPTDTVSYDVIFNGSLSRLSLVYTEKDKFTVYKYNIKVPYDIYINGKIDTYGNEEKYDKNEYNNSPLTNHYGAYYGGDAGEIIYDFHNNNKENLLFITTSYSNSVNNLIASHFNKTYVIDLRHYEKDMGKVFNVQEYIKDNKISKCLIMGDVESFYNSEFDMKGVE